MVRTNKKLAWLRDYTPYELETLVASEPLTQNDVQEILGEKVERIHFLSPQRLNAKGMILHLCSARPRTEKVNIYIQNNSREEEEITLVHEVVHLRYRTGDEIPYRESDSGQMRSVLGMGDPFYGKHKTFEDIVEAEAQRFYAENRAFVSDLYSGVLRKYGSQCSNLSKNLPIKE